MSHNLSKFLYVNLRVYAYATHWITSIKIKTKKRNCLIKEHLRGSIHEILKRRKKREDPVGNELEIAVSQVVHEVDTSNINKIGCEGSRSDQQSSDHWYCEEHEI